MNILQLCIGCNLYRKGHIIPLEAQSRIPFIDIGYMYKTIESKNKSINKGDVKAFRGICFCMVGPDICITYKQSITLLMDLGDPTQWGFHNRK